MEWGVDLRGTLGAGIASAAAHRMSVLLQGLHDEQPLKMFPYLLALQPQLEKLSPSPAAHRPAGLLECSLPSRLWPIRSDFF